MTSVLEPQLNPDLPGLAGDTVVGAFRATVEARGDAAALRHRTPSGWQTMTWRQYGAAVDEVAAGLAGIGIEPGDRVAILSANRPEWHIADLATMRAGAATVPLYVTSSASQLAYVLNHSGARACFVQNAELLARILLKRPELPDLEHVILFEGYDGLDDGLVVPWSQVRADGRRAVWAPPVIDPSDLASIVYTSGTTGRPKGAMLSHRNLVSTVHSVTGVVRVGPSDRCLSFLPLSHIAERITSHIGQLVSGGETWFARSLATVGEDLLACRPTIVFAVPRVWEKLQAGVLEAVGGLRRPQRDLVERYLAMAAAEGRLTIMQRVERSLLDRVVGAKLRAQLGLDKAHTLISGAAPIYPPLLSWFAGIGLPIREVYGQTEDCGPTSLNPGDRIRIGTVGPPLPGVDVRVAADGEILVRSANVTPGYFRDPSGTADLIDAEGWMHSGDLGALDADGYLTVTGRKKDLIINASGKNIAPASIEDRLRYETLISQAVVVGDRRPYLVALLTLDAEAAAEWVGQRGRIVDLEFLASDPELLAEVGDEVARVNAELSRPEQLKKWRVLARDFTVSADELTATLKVRREAVIRKFATVIDELYATPSAQDAAA